MHQAFASLQAAKCAVDKELRRRSSVETRLSSVEEDITRLIAWQQETEQREAGARGGAGGCRWHGPPPGLAAVKKESGSLW